MTIRSISDVLTDLSAALTSEIVSVGEILAILHERGLGFLLLIFALPMALPLPVPPGINILLASPLIILTAQQALGRHTIWLPQFIKNKTFARVKLQKLISKCLPWTKKIERLIKPRLKFITQGISLHLIGLLGFIMALTICIPLPLTNTVPSLSIALMAVGVIMRDGLATLTGALIGMTWVFMLSFVVIFLGTEGIDMVKEAIKSFL